MINSLFKKIFKDRISDLEGKLSECSSIKDEYRARSEELEVTRKSLNEFKDRLNVESLSNKKELASILKERSMLEMEQSILSKSKEEAITLIEIRKRNLEESLELIRKESRSAISEMERISASREAMIEENMVILSERSDLLIKKEKLVESQRSYIDQLSSDLKSEIKNSLNEMEKCLASREYVIEQNKKNISELTDLLDKREKFLELEKESLSGKDGAEIKRDILLPKLKKKWEAEAGRIDAEREDILKSSHQVKDSLMSRRSILESCLLSVRKKPSTSHNQNLSVEYESRLKELDEIIAIIDKERIHADLDVSVPDNNVSHP